MDLPEGNRRSVRLIAQPGQADEVVRVLIVPVPGQIGGGGLPALQGVPMDGDLIRGGRSRGLTTGQQDQRQDQGEEAFHRASHFPCIFRRKKDGMVPQGQYSGAVREKSTGKWLQNGYETGTNDYKKGTNCRLKENSGAGIKPAPPGFGFRIGCTSQSF